MTFKFPHAAHRNEIFPIFVYGTLKRGEEREGQWPKRPMRVTVATTLGRLFDLGPYPALVEGDDVVAGELWHIAAGDLDETLHVLDGIECVLPEGNSLYDRRIVRCRNETGQMMNAYAYFYARANDLAGKTPLVSSADGCVRWRGRS